MRTENTDKKMLRYIYILDIDNKGISSKFYGLKNILYTGQTNNLKRRMGEHMIGINSKYLKNNFKDAYKIPIYIEYLFGTEYDAIERETKLKSMSKDKKLKLIDSDLNMLVGYNKIKKIMILKKQENNNENFIMPIFA